MWESEREYLADLLKVERPARDKNAIHGSSPSREPTQNASELPQHPPGNKKHVRDELRSDVTRKDEEDAARDGREDDSHAEDVEDQETEEALRWLEAVWNSKVKILKQEDPEIHWDDVY